MNRCSCDSRTTTSMHIHKPFSQKKMSERYKFSTHTHHKHFLRIFSSTHSNYTPDKISALITNPACRENKC